MACSLMPACVLAITMRSSSGENLENFSMMIQFDKSDFKAILNMFTYGLIASGISLAIDIALTSLFGSIERDLSVKNSKRSFFKEINAKIIQVLILSISIILTTAMTMMVQQVGLGFKQYRLMIANNPKSFIRDVMSLKLITFISSIHLTMRLAINLAGKNFSLAEAFTLCQGLVPWLLEAGLRTFGSDKFQYLQLSDNLLWRLYILLQAVVIGMIFIGASNYLLLISIRRSVGDSRVFKSLLFYASTLACVLLIRHWVMGFGIKFNSQVLDQNIDDPFLWTLNFVNVPQNKVILTWWLSCLCGMILGIYFMDISKSRVKRSTLSVFEFEFQRKFFHWIGVAMFLPATILAPSFTYLAYGVAFSFFIYVEYLRIFKVWIPYGDDNYINHFVVKYTEQDNPPVAEISYESSAPVANSLDGTNFELADLDSLRVRPVLCSEALKKRPKLQRNHHVKGRKGRSLNYLSRVSNSSNRTWDLGPLVLSHIYLILGFSMPLWMSLIELRNDQMKSNTSYIMSCLAACSGIVAAGIGDSLAALFGKKMGKTLWVRNSSSKSTKTVEGSIGCLFGCLIGFIFVIFLANNFTLPYNQPNIDTPRLIRSVLVASFGATILEATSFQNDNILLPLWCTTVFNLL